MTPDVAPQDQLAEIHRLLSSGEEGDGGDRRIFLTWGALTLGVAAACAWMGYLRVGDPRLYTLAWAVHNVLGWGATFAFQRRAERESGRVSRRGGLICRAWAAVNLALWGVVWMFLGPHWIGAEAINPLIGLLIGLGVLVTGLLTDLSLVQGIGAATGLGALLLPLGVPPAWRSAAGAGVVALPFLALGLLSLLGRRKST